MQKGRGGLIGVPLNSLKPAAGEAEAVFVNATTTVLPSIMVWFGRMFVFVCVQVNEMCMFGGFGKGNHAPPRYS